MDEPEMEPRGELQVVYYQTTRRRRLHLPAPIRYAIIAAAGSGLGYLTFYVLRRVGY